MIATTIDNTTDRTVINIKAWLYVIIEPNGTFIPRNEDIIVGIDRTIVAPAKNFII